MKTNTHLFLGSALSTLMTDQSLELLPGIEHYVLVFHVGENFGQNEQANHRPLMRTRHGPLRPPSCLVKAGYSLRRCHFSLVD